MRIATRRTLYDWILAILSFTALIYMLLPLLSYRELSDTALIPIHYNIMGDVDNWGSKVTLLYLAGAGVILYILLSISERFYKKFSYPIRVTSNNEDQIYRLGVRLIRHVNLFSTLIFANIINHSFAMIDKKQWLFGIPSTAIIIGLMIFIMVVFLFRMMMAKSDVYSA